MDRFEKGVVYRVGGVNGVGDILVTDRREQVFFDGYACGRRKPIVDEFFPEIGEYFWVDPYHEAPVQVFAANVETDIKVLWKFAETLFHEVYPYDDFDALELTGKEIPEMIRQLVDLL